MTYFLWSLPTLAVLAAIGSGRVNATVAAMLGLAVAVPIALWCGPAASFGGGQLGIALLRGLWIGATIVPYILGGLLFWQVAACGSVGRLSTSLADVPVADCSAATPIARRRLVFFACFLVGPFAESVTGFGVGMLGTVMLLRRLGLAPRHLMVFALMSQTLIPWGGMGSGTLLAAAYARIPPTQLALHTVVPVALLMLIWLSLFWRTARLAGLSACLSECLREAAWIACGLALLTLATAGLGPETALLAAFGPLIVLRYLLDVRPDRQQALAAARKVLPYMVLIGALALTRLVPSVRTTLGAWGRVVPFDDLPAWAPLLHAGSWLIVGGLVTAFARRQGGLVGSEARAAWRTGKHAVLTVFLFAMMAEVLAASGIASAFATAMFEALDDKVILVTPLLSGAFAILTNSGSPSNSLFLPSQVALALQAGLSVPAVAALQNASGACLGFFSPVRMSIAAGLANGHGEERSVYALLLTYAIAAFVLMVGIAFWVISTPVSSG